LLHHGVTYDATPVGWHRYDLDPVDIIIFEFSLLDLGPYSQKLCLVNRPYQLPVTDSFLTIRAERYTPQRNNGLKCYFTIFIIHNVKV